MIFNFFFVETRLHRVNRGCMHDMIILPKISSARFLEDRIKGEEIHEEICEGNLIQQVAVREDTFDYLYILLR